MSARAQLDESLVATAAAALLLHVESETAPQAAPERGRGGVVIDNSSDGPRIMALIHRGSLEAQHHERHGRTPPFRLVLREEECAAWMAQHLGVPTEDVLPAWRALVAHLADELASGCPGASTTTFRGLGLWLTGDGETIFATPLDGDPWDGVAEEMGAWGDLALVIDTDTCAGNFARELCAACAGLHDDTSYTAEELASVYDGPDLGYDGAVLVCMTMDGKGYPRWATMCRTPGTGENQSVCIRLLREPTPEELDGIKQRALALAKNGAPRTEQGTGVHPFAITGFRITRERTCTQSRPV